MCGWNLRQRRNAVFEDTHNGGASVVVEQGSLMPRALAFGRVSAWREREGEREDDASCYAEGMLQIME
jgi:hypothetical protein